VIYTVRLVLLEPSKRGWYNELEIQLGWGSKKFLERGYLEDREGNVRIILNLP
jgi:hypothetical protein